MSCDCRSTSPKAGGRGAMKGVRHRVYWTFDMIFSLHENNDTDTQRVIYMGIVASARLH